MHFCPGTMTTHAQSQLIQFLSIQIPTDRISGTRTRATQMLTNTIVEICSTPLTTAPRRSTNNHWPRNQL